MSLKGSCLCGQIQYQINGELKDVLNCHCSMCRKAHGSAFRTRASIRSSKFSWLYGEQLITSYESSPGEHRTFCSRCGSNLITTFDDDPDTYGFPLGTLDDHPGVSAKMHVFVGSKATWHQINDELPQWEEKPS
jgi:hypothetical protein